MTKKKFIRWVSRKHGQAIADDCRKELNGKSALTTDEGLSLLGRILTRRQAPASNGNRPSTGPGLITGVYAADKHLIKQTR